MHIKNLIYKLKFFNKSIINSIINFISNFLDLNFYTRRLIVSLFDWLIINLSIILTLSMKDYFLNYSVFKNYVSLILFSWIIFIPIYASTGQYRSVLRYTGSFEIYKIFLRNLLFVFLVFLNGLIFNFYNLETELWIILWLINSTGIILVRLIIKDIIIISKAFKNTKKIYIYGAGSAGAQLAMALKISGKYSIKGFIDDNHELVGRSLDGIKIFDPLVVFNETDIDQILLAIPSLSKNERYKIIQKIEKTFIPILEIPSFDELTSGNAKIDNLKPICIEELLEREPFKSSLEKNTSNLKGKESIL